MLTILQGYVSNTQIKVWILERVIDGPVVKFGPFCLAASFVYLWLRIEIVRKSISSFCKLEAAVF